MAKNLPWPPCPGEDTRPYPMDCLEDTGIMSKYKGITDCCWRDTWRWERTVLFKTISLDGTKPNINPKTKTNPNPKLTQILTWHLHVIMISATRKTTSSKKHYLNFSPALTSQYNLHRAVLQRCYTQRCYILIAHTTVDVRSPRWYRCCHQIPY